MKEDVSQIQSLIERKSVLCVEDNVDTCELLALVFAEYDFTAAQDVQTALELIGKRNFDVYILDNWLPDGSGIELCRRICENNQGAKVIFTSAVGQKSEIQRAKDAGATEYLIKPYDPENLQKIIKDLLGRDR